MSKQRYSSIADTNTAPEQRSRLKASSGFWSLSTLSNVPYVRFEGPGGYQKTFSWGEIVEVPEGAQADVFNASAHVGDIVLNGGSDYGAVPARITVPVELIDPVTGLVIAVPPVGIQTVRTRWNADVRRARRAFFVTTFDDIAAPQLFTVTGFANTRSHRTQNGIVATPGSSTGVGYRYNVTLGAATQGLVLPLGYNAALGVAGEPHVLLDSVEVQWTQGVGADLFPLTSYYVMEY